MNSKYIILKGSWGIVIYLTVEEILSLPVESSDIKVSETIHFRIGENINFPRSTIIKYMVPAISELSNQIVAIRHKTQICLNLKSLDFALSDFQEEGLYCAIQEWIARYYNIEIR